MRNAHRQKNILLKNAQANGEGNFFMRYFFLLPKKKFKLFSPRLFSLTFHVNATTGYELFHKPALLQSLCNCYVTERLNLGEIRLAINDLGM